MDLLVLFVVALFVYFDAGLLERKCPGSYREIFRLSGREKSLGLVFLILLSWAALTDMSGVVPAGMLLILGVYILRRDRFFLVSKSFSDPQEPRDDSRLDLALCTFGIVGRWVLVMIVSSLLIEGIDLVTGQAMDKLAKVVLMSEISAVSLLVLIYRAVRRYPGISFAEVLGLRGPRLGTIRGFIVPALLAFIYACLASTVLDSRLVQPITPLQEMLNETTSMGVFLFFMMTAVLTAPFLEEIIFRGFLFYVLRAFRGMFFTVGFVTILFAVLHMDQYWGDWAAIIAVGGFGLVLTMFRERTGSAIPGIVAHYVYNLSMVLIPLAGMIMANPSYFDYQINFHNLTDSQKEERLLSAIEQNPKFAASYNDLAWIYSQQGIHLERALELVEKSLEMEPNNDAFWDTKAEVLFGLGRREEAVEIAERLYKKYPHDEHIRKQLEKFRSPVDNPAGIFNSFEFSDLKNI